MLDSGFQRNGEMIIIITNENVDSTTSIADRKVGYETNVV
jgi:hypothetical protein